LAPKLKIEVMMIKMQMCQIIMVCIIALNLLIGANQHGKPKEGVVNFWSILLGQLILAALLIIGGFFSY
jgi:hypothetical protein